jgi:glycosyltransferase involved in cell wall biosynthesis
MHNDQKMTISALMPVYNGARHLPAALQSIFQQRHLPSELIIVDDGSSDGSAHVIRESTAASPLPVHYVYQANQGIGATRNRCLQLASGQLIAFLDQDDCWMPEKLAQQRSLLAAHPDAHGAIGHTSLAFDPDAQDAEAPLHGRTGLILLLQASLFRRSLFALAGMFDPLKSGDEDIDWFLRVLEKPVKLLVHTDHVLTYRRHAGNLTGTLARSRHQFVVALQHALARRRREGGSGERTAEFAVVPLPPLQETATAADAPPRDRTVVSRQHR